MLSETEGKVYSNNGTKSLPELCSSVLQKVRESNNVVYLAEDIFKQSVGVPWFLLTAYKRNLKIKLLKKKEPE